MRRIRIQRVERPHTEVGGQLRHVDLAARGQVQAAELALGHVVPIDIRPRQGRGDIAAGEGVVIGDKAGQALEVVPVQRKLERGLRVTEQILGGAKAWRPGVPGRQVIDSRKRAHADRNGPPGRSAPRSPGSDAQTADLD